ncbi:MAG: hypothetical protein AAFQ84_04410 [Pseudomonadota bacterium]
MSARALAFTFVIGISGCASGSLNSQSVKPLPEFHRCELSGSANGGSYTITKTLTLDGKPYKPINAQEYFRAEWRQEVGDVGSYGDGKSGYSLGITWVGEQTSLLSRDTAAVIVAYFPSPIPERYKVIIERPNSSTPPGWINLEMQTFFQNSNTSLGKSTIERMRLSDLLAISDGESTVVVKIIDEEETVPGMAQQSMTIRVADIEPALLELGDVMSDFEQIVDNYDAECPKYQDEKIYVVSG